MPARLCQRPGPLTQPGGHGLVALDAAAAAALPLANRTPPLSPLICRVTCVVPSVLCWHETREVARVQSDCWYGMLINMTLTFPHTNDSHRNARNYRIDSQTPYFHHWSTHTLAKVTFTPRLDTWASIHTLAKVTFTLETKVLGGSLCSADCCWSLSMNAYKKKKEKNELTELFAFCWLSVLHFVWYELIRWCH